MYLASWSLADRDEEFVPLKYTLPSRSPQSPPSPVSMTVLIRNSPLSPLDFFNYVYTIGPVLVARTTRELGFGWVT